MLGNVFSIDYPLLHRMIICFLRLYYMCTTCVDSLEKTDGTDI